MAEELVAGGTVELLSNVGSKLRSSMNLHRSVLSRKYGNSVVATKKKTFFSINLLFNKKWDKQIRNNYLVITIFLPMSLMLNNYIFE